MTYVKVNVNKPSGIAPGKGGDKKDIITIIDLADLNSEASRDASGIVIAGNHSFKTDCYAVKLEVTQDTIVCKSTSQGDMDAEGFLHEVVFSHPGSSQEIREFRQNWVNKNVLVIVERCSNSEKNQFGATCAPLRMKIEATDDKDKNNALFTFSSALKGPDVAIYQGTIIYSEVVATVAPDATTINLVGGGGEYQLQDNTGATEITTCTNAVNGIVFTLLGSGGSFPSTITDDHDFILADGTTWTALGNAKITFKVFKNGVATYKFIEQSRS
jgi:hypothetical protein